MHVEQARALSQNEDTPPLIRKAQSLVSLHTLACSKIAAAASQGDNTVDVVACSWTIEALQESGFKVTPIAPLPNSIHNAVTARVSWL